MTGKIFSAISCAAAILLVLCFAVSVNAAPPAQNPTPTDEPTKRPYLFPTPIFIPTFISATDLPPRGATGTPRPISPTATTQPPVLTAAPGQSPPAATRTDIAALSEETQILTLGPESSTTTDLAQSAADALVAMGVVIFLGFLVISGTAILVYRRSQREEKIGAIKARLKNK